MTALPLPAEALTALHLAPTFDSTADLTQLPGIVGQERAREAVEFGVALRSRGYNLFVLGPAGLGKRTLVQQMLRARAEQEPAPPDWCYVNNFKQPHRPRAVELPRGRGVQLRQDMEHFVEELRGSVPAMFESEEYRNRAEQIDTEISERQEKVVDLGQESAATTSPAAHPAGFSLAPAQQRGAEPGGIRETPGTSAPDPGEWASCRRSCESDARSAAPAEREARASSSSTAR
jgi:hypothetical protein